RTLLEAVDGRDVVEQEGQVEQLDLLRIAVELRQRRRDELHVAEQHRLHLLGVAEQLRTREHLHLDLARQKLLGHLLELQRALPLRRRLGDHVAELDDHRPLRECRGRDRERDRAREDCSDEFHAAAPFPVDLTDVGRSGPRLPSGLPRTRAGGALARTIVVPYGPRQDEPALALLPATGLRWSATGPPGQRPGPARSW